MKELFRNAISNNYPFWVFGIISVILLIISFFLPPTGEINKTVIEGVAELFAFASLGAIIKAIDKGASATITHGSTSMTINNDEEEQNIPEEE